MDCLDEPRFSGGVSMGMRRGSGSRIGLPSMFFEVAAAVFSMHSFCLGLRRAADPTAGMSGSLDGPVLQRPRPHRSHGRCRCRRRHRAASSLPPDARSVANRLRWRLRHHARILGSHKDTRCFVPRSEPLLSPWRRPRADEAAPARELPPPAVAPAIQAAMAWLVASRRCPVPGQQRHQAVARTQGHVEDTRKARRKAMPWVTRRPALHRAE